MSTFCFNAFIFQFSICLYFSKNDNILYFAAALFSWNSVFHMYKYFHTNRCCILHETLIIHNQVPMSSVCPFGHPFVLLAIRLFFWLFVCAFGYSFVLLAIRLRF